VKENAGDPRISAAGAAVATVLLRPHVPNLARMTGVDNSGRMVDATFTSIVLPRISGDGHVSLDLA
jgi:hypothetical protein